MQVHYQELETHGQQGEWGVCLQGWFIFLDSQKKVFYKLLFSY